MAKVNPLVHKQYEEWPLPEPIADISNWRIKGGFSKCDLALDHNIFWPERRYKSDMSILVAGCGTLSAALAAYDNPSASVLGIDVSSRSLEHTAHLKKKHNLENLELQQIDLHNVGSLGRKFDFIECYGVLHHLPDPSTGLSALAQALNDDGVILVGLYSKYLRAGVYMLQEALRRLQIEQTTEGIDFVRELIATLPARHPLHLYFQNAQDVSPFNTEIVDMFLHKQDRPYSVPEILSLASECNLEFQGWFDNLDYYPEGILPRNQNLYQRLTQLPEREQWAAVELLSPPYGSHRFLLRKKTNNPSKFKIHFEEPFFANLIPTPRRLLHAASDKKGMILKREWHQLKIDGLEEELFLRIDGASTVGEIMGNVIKKHNGTADKIYRFFQRMWKLGHITLHMSNA